MLGKPRTTRLRLWTLAVIAPVAVAVSIQACSSDGAGATGTAQLRKAKPAVSISLAAAPVGQTKGKAGLTPGLAKFKPARPGRKVQVQAQVGKRWKVVTTVVQDKRGRAAFNVPAAKKGKPIAYRVTAVKTKKDKPLTSKAVKSANWKLTWGDEFSGSGALDARWQTRQAGMRDPEGRRLCSEVRAANASKSGGSANLVVKQIGPKKCKGQDGKIHFEYSNAMVSAQDPAFQFKYGFAAARVKFQSIRGMHSAFWLQRPDDLSDLVAGAGAADNGAEIDIAEYFGDGRKDGGLAHYVHSVGANGKTTSVGGVVNSDKLLKKGKEWSDDWHVYSVEWTPKQYVFRVDGNVVLQTTKAISHRTQAVILSSLSSDWETVVMNNKKLPSVTKYDWVRIYQQPGA